MGQFVYNFGRIASGTSHSKLDLAARIGYGAKGFVYSTVGVLAVMAAVGFANGKLTGTKGALRALADASWGTLILGLLALGLFSFTLWRLVQAFKDTEEKGSDLKGLMQRAGLAISGLIYAWLGYYAVRILSDGGGGSSSTQERAATVMAHDGGVLLIGAIGAGFIGVGLWQFYRAVTGRFKRNWKTAEMTAKEEQAATLVSRFGIGSRAVSFAIVGGFLVRAAMTTDPQKAAGLSGALSELAQQTSGQWLVGLAGIGLLCYGLYCMINALFRRIEAGGDANDDNPASHDTTTAQAAH